MTPRWLRYEVDRGQIKLVLVQVPEIMEQKEMWKHTVLRLLQEAEGGVLNIRFNQLTVEDALDITLRESDADS